MLRIVIAITMIIAFSHVDMCNKNEMVSSQNIAPKSMKSKNEGKKGGSCNKRNLCEKNLLCIQGVCREDGSSAAEPIHGL